jgi:hypothetical protein
VAYSTYPIDDASGMNLAQYQTMAAAQAPDAIVSGLAVTAIGNVIRMAAGKAIVAGCVFVNSASVDVGTVAGNFLGVTRIDRLILRLTFTGGIKVQPVIVSGTTLDGPSLTQTLAGTYEIPLARWGVLNGGPGPCAAAWALDAFKMGRNAVLGFDGLGSPFAVSPGASYGPSPASINGQNLRITLPGIYSISYRVLLMNAGLPVTPDALPWISLGLADDTAYAGFQMSLNTQGLAHGRARIVETFALRGDQVPFEVAPRMYQASSGDQDTYLRLRIVRHR